MLRLLAEADIKWRCSTALWLPYHFKPIDIPRLLITTTSVLKDNILVSYASSSNVAASGGLSISISETKSTLERSSSISSAYSEAQMLHRSPSMSSLSSSHSMAKLKKIYSKGNYNNLHAKMRKAGGRISEFQGNINSLIEKNQIFDFSQHSDRDASESVSDAGMVLGGFVSGFLTESGARNLSKRKIPVPRMDGFVSSLTTRSGSLRSKKSHSRPLPHATVDKSSVSGAPSGVVHSSSLGALNVSTAPGNGVMLSDANPPSPAPTVASPSNSTSLFGNNGPSTSVPSVITSTIFGSPELARAAQIAAGLVDDNGVPFIGSLTPSTNCMTRTWLGNTFLVDLNQLKPLQENCVSQLESFCEQVPPSCPVDMGEFLLLISAAPIELPASQKPHPIVRRVASSEDKNVKDSSALFYDPFLAKRDRLKESSKGPKDVVWAKGALCKVVVHLSNPLTVSIRLCNVTVIMEDVSTCTAVAGASASGKCYEVTPENVDVPAVFEGGDDYELMLSVTPRREGRLKVIGIRYFIRNAVYVSLVGDDGRGSTKRPEIAEAWSYPRLARTANRSPLKCGSNSSVSMTVTVGPDAAAVRLFTSWPAPDSSDQSPVVTLCEGECRRETIVVTNTSNIEIQDFRLSCDYAPRWEPGSSPVAKGLRSMGEAVTSIDPILLPWSGPLKDNNDQLGPKKVNKMSARAAAAILDYKNFIEEQKKMSEGEVVFPMKSSEEPSDLEEDDTATPLVRVVSVEAMDYKQVDSFSVLPIAAFGSIKITLEYYFRADLLINPTLSPTAPHTADNCDNGCYLNLTLSYISEDPSALTSKGSDAANTIVYYRMAALESLIRPVGGISLSRLYVSNPASFVGWPISSDNANGSQFAPDVTNDPALLTEGQQITDHIATILAENLRLSEKHSSSVKVVGDALLLVLQFNNDCPFPAVVFSRSEAEFSEPSPNLDPNVQAISGILSQETFVDKLYYCADDFFGDQKETGGFLVMLRPHSSKNVFVKLNSLRLPYRNELSVNSFSSVLMKKLRSLSWCYSNDTSGLITSGTLNRKGTLSRRFLSYAMIKNIAGALILPPVSFACAQLGTSERTSHLIESSPLSATNRLAIPAATRSDDSVIRAFKLVTTSLSIRKFYKFSTIVRFFGGSCDEADNIKRRVEVAVIVFEGHHIGMSQVGPGVGRQFGDRLGASYVLPIVAVDPLPPAAATAVGIASSSAMREERPTTQSENRQLDFTQLQRTDPSFRRPDVGPHPPRSDFAPPLQSKLVCSGVLVSGQLRRMFEVNSQGNQPISIDHSLNLCFTNAGMFSVYVVARVWTREAAVPVGSAEWGPSSPWWMNSSPLLISVAV